MTLNIHCPTNILPISYPLNISECEPLLKLYEDHAQLESESWLTLWMGTINFVYANPILCFLLHNTQVLMGGKLKGLKFYTQISGKFGVRACSRHKTFFSLTWQIFYTWPACMQARMHSTCSSYAIVLRTIQKQTWNYVTHPTLGILCSIFTSSGLHTSWNWSSNTYERSWKVHPFLKWSRNNFLIVLAKWSMQYDQANCGLPESYQHFKH